MNLVYIIREDYLSHLGGDSIQMMKTKEYVEQISPDIHIQICNNLDEHECIKNADLVHIFNLQTIDFSCHAYELCKKYHRRVVLSPIFWDLKDSLISSGFFNFFNLTPHKWMESFSSIEWKILMSIPSFKNRVGILGVNWKKAKKLLEMVDYILPNSVEELEQLIHIYKLEDNIKKKSSVVPNAIEKEAKSKQIKSTLNIPSGYVLQVGRIGTVKNQIKVLQALRDRKDMPIVFIGKIENQKYYYKCQSIARKRGNVHFIDSVPHEEMHFYYQNAVCHVNPSFRESPGLASMEALYNGTPIVTSNSRYCPCGYYQFDEIAYLCNPYSTSSVFDAIMKAVENRKSRLPNNDYFDFYSYNNAAKITLDAYKSLIINEKERKL